MQKKNEESYASLDTVLNSPWPDVMAQVLYKERIDPKTLTGEEEAIFEDYTNWDDAQCKVKISKFEIKEKLAVLKIGDREKTELQLDVVARLRPRTKDTMAQAEREAKRFDGKCCCGPNVDWAEFTVKVCGHPMADRKYIGRKVVLEIAPFATAKEACEAFKGVLDEIETSPKEVES